MANVGEEGFILSAMAGPNKLVTHHSTSFDFGPASTGAMIGQEIVPGLGELVFALSPRRCGYLHAYDVYARKTKLGVHTRASFRESGMSRLSTSVSACISPIASISTMRIARLVHPGGLSALLAFRLRE
ncbi:uncharacterized protein CIMG_10540 [Coccidioides immitis RS]|uniref:Uncharacterized protein n=1 Tax=Coccidioides immitis (strain RS) TaxID=246410 RepID=A0A0D8JT82_COCIM|nr:uncharacterized protein CIMG_10540 [Coccidioides immitis RS]KJF60329.1 hypothetical protein CIMG_10540 [Coccidioides immitis RS]